MYSTFFLIEYIKTKLFVSAAAASLLPILYTFSYFLFFIFILGCIKTVLIRLTQSNYSAYFFLSPICYFVDFENIKNFK